MRILRAATLAVGFLVGSGSTGLSQEAGDTVRSVSALLKAQESCWHVRATLLDGGTAEGRVRNVETSSATIGSLRLSPDQITLLERRLADQTDTKRGALIGGVAGVLFGTLVLYPFCDYGSGGRCDEGMTLVLGSTALGAVLGATTGGILSIGETTWEPVWSR